MMRNAFYFMLQLLFILQIFIFLPWRLGYVEKRFDEKAMVNFDVKYDATNWTLSNYNTYINQHIKKKR